MSFVAHGPLVSLSHLLALAAVMGEYYPSHYLGHVLGTMMKEKKATIVFQFLKDCPK